MRRYSILGKLTEKKYLKSPSKYFLKKKKEKKKYFKDILTFLKLFLKELDERYQIIKEKERNGKLSEKDPFENLIIYKIKFNYWADKCSRFFYEFPVKSLSKEQILERIQTHCSFKHRPTVIRYLLNHTPEETCKKFNLARERLSQLNQVVFYDLFKDTEEYTRYKNLEKIGKKLGRNTVRQKTDTTKA